MGESSIDVTEATFEAEVLERSRQVPVLVDFWAPWCGPCRTLGPVLERVADDMAGSFVLAKVNSDENPYLSSSLGVRGIPNVMLFKDGQIADSFVGALPETAVREFLRRHVSTAADRDVAEAERLAAAGETEKARRKLESAVAAGGAAADAAHLGLARLAMAAGDLDAVATHVGSISATSDSAVAGRALEEALDLVREAHAAGTIAELSQRLSAEPENLEARYALAGHEVGRGRYREALEQLLAVARADRGWRDEAARRAMLLVFNVVGARDPLSDEFRDRLRTVYY
ncbi:MAG: thioredoxin [Thermoanaerobaculia bacterium]|nr:thioredoxin [Thermoanaerobaculia bacterium]